MHQYAEQGFARPYGIGMAVQYYFKAVLVKPLQVINEEIIHNMHD